ncbi:MFS transporter [Clostridiaceae bacterium 35-E11]
MKRWQINLYTLWFSQILSLMSFGLGLPFMPFYIQELGVTDPDQLKLYTGILNAAPALAMGIMAPIWGMLSDKWGKKLMLLRSMLFASFILAGMGLVKSVEHLVVLRVLQGFFTGTVTASAALVASDAPSHRLSYALGFLSSSTFIGYSAGPAIGGFIAEGVGYRISFIIGGILMLLDFFLVLFVVKENKDSLLVSEKSFSNKFSFISFFSSTLVAMLLLLFFMRISRTIFNPYLPLYVQEMRSSTTGNVTTTGIINGLAGLMTALSGLTLSRLGDRYNKLNILKLLFATGILLSLPLFFIKTLLGFAILYGIFFFAIGGIEPIVMSITSEMIPSEKRGSLFGIQALVGSIGWAISPLLGGFVSIKFSIKSIFILIPIFLFLALLTSIVTSNMSKTVVAQK